MIIRNTFSVPLPVEDAWTTLIDVENIVTCVPGATLTEKTDDTTYKGQIAVRLGPVALKFKGAVQFLERNEAEHRALLKGKGTDTNGRGGAEANVTFTLEPGGDNGTSVAHIETDLKLSGSIAQYGRGEGMISDLANMLVDQFADALRAKLSVQAQQQASQDDGGPAPAPASAPEAAKPISGFSLMLKVLWNAIRRQFGKA